MILGDSCFYEIENMLDSDKRSSYFAYLLSKDANLGISYGKVLKRLENLVQEHIGKDFIYSIHSYVTGKVSYKTDNMYFLVSIAGGDNRLASSFYEIYEFLGNYTVSCNIADEHNFKDVLSEDKELQTLFMDLFDNIRIARLNTKGWLEYRLSGGYIPNTNEDSYEIEYGVSFRDDSILSDSFSKYYSIADDLPLNMNLGKYLEWVYDSRFVFDEMQVDKLLSLASNEEELLSNINLKDKKLIILALVYLYKDTSLLKLTLEDTEISKLLEGSGLYAKYSFGCEIDFIYDVLSKVASIDLLNVLLETKDLTILDEVSIKFKTV